MLLYSGARLWTWSSKISSFAHSSEINNHRHAWIMLQFILGKWISRTYWFLCSRHLLPRAVDLTGLAVSCVLACKCWKQMLTYSCAIIVAKIVFSGVWQIKSIQVVGVECFQSGVSWSCSPPFWWNYLLCGIIFFVESCCCYCYYFSCWIRLFIDALEQFLL